MKITRLNILRGFFYCLFSYNLVCVICAYSLCPTLSHFHFTQDFCLFIRCLNTQTFFCFLDDSKSWLVLAVGSEKIPKIISGLLVRFFTCNKAWSKQQPQEKKIAFFLSLNLKKKFVQQAKHSPLL